MSKDETRKPPDWAQLPDAVVEREYILKMLRRREEWNSRHTQNSNIARILRATIESIERLEHHDPTVELTSSVRCVVNGCTNERSQGAFVDGLCAPCHAFIVHGRGVHSQAFRNSLMCAGIIGLKVANLEHCRGGLQDDNIEFFPAWSEHKARAMKREP